MSTKELIEALRLELREHNYNYYVRDNAIISDYDFDIKLKDLQKLELNTLSFLMLILQHNALVGL